MLAERLARPRALSTDSVAVLSFVLLSAIYFAKALALASSAPFWMDEILTLWTARLPDVPAVWSALVRGAEFTPPLYDLLIHALTQLGVTSALGLRLPSILAIFVAALATGAIARRRLGTGPALVAAGVMLSSGLFGYAVQMRPYALVTAAFACALALYDGRGKGRAAGVALLLALAIGLHFYALLLAGGLALFELARAYGEKRRPDWPMLIATGVAMASILFWLPILFAARAYSGGDVGAPGYYAQPVMPALLRTYAVLTGWLIVPLVGLLVARLLAGQRKPVPLLPLSLALAGVPLLVFAFALLVSHSYADRYALAGTIGIALLFAGLAAQVRHAAPVLLALLVAGSVWQGTGELGKADRIDALTIAASAPGTLPVVTGSGLRFFEITERLPDTRIVFLDTPGAPPDDPTNRNQLLRWKAIRPDLRIADAQAFLCTTPAFLLFAQPGDGGADSLPGWLPGRADFTPPPAGRASLTLVRPHPCKDMR